MGDQVGEQGLFLFNPVNRYTGFLSLLQAFLVWKHTACFGRDQGGLEMQNVARAHPGSLGLFNDWGSHSWERS